MSTSACPSPCFLFLTPEIGPPKERTHISQRQRGKSTSFPFKNSSLTYLFFYSFLGLHPMNSIPLSSTSHAKDALSVVCHGRGKSPCALSGREWSLPLLFWSSRNQHFRSLFASTPWMPWSAAEMGNDETFFCCTRKYLAFFFLQILTQTQEFMSFLVILAPDRNPLLSEKLSAKRNRPKRTFP